VKRLLPLLVLPVLLAGCSGSTPVAAPADPLPPTAAPSTAAPTTAGPGPSYDWDRPRTVALAGGLSLGRCEGDAPLVCVRRGGRVVGVLELLRFPLSSLPALAGKSGREALDAQAAEYVGSFTRDRAQGCGSGYEVTPLPVRHLTAADGAVVSYGFTGTLASGAPSEHVVQWAGIRGKDLVLLSAAAYERTGCLPPEGDAFDVATLREAAPLLDAVVAASPLA
jgi:hypothetical protein